MNRPVVPPPPEPPVEPPALWLRRGDQLFVGTLVIAAIGLMGLYGLRLTGWGQTLVEIDRLPARQYDYQLDINQAPWVEWTLLDGIGEKTARRIVAFRDEHGPFKTIEDVGKVPGIGPKTWEQIRPWLMIGKSPNQPARNK
ncbi:MAG: helix-hairpin-helix domain-containing protein [Planctomycetota bacterium]